MSMTDPIGDMLTRIRNAQQRGKNKVISPPSRLRERVLAVLQQEGFIRGFSTTEQDGKRAELEIELKYFDGEPVIRDIRRVSKPGRRVYASVDSLPTDYTDAGGHTVDEVAIVGDEHQGAVVLVQRVLEYLATAQVEVVRRLVE